MGVKAWFVAYYTADPKETWAAAPVLDREASAALARQMFPAFSVEKEDGSLLSLDPEKREVFVGVYGDLTIIAHVGLSGDHPSRIDPMWDRPDLGAKRYVHATHSVVDWCAFALWEEGKLVRALSVSPDNGVIEDIGAKLPFEIPFWHGGHPVEAGEDYPLPFHPLELSDEALLAMVGFQYEGFDRDTALDPGTVPILRFGLSKKPWWKIW